MILQTQYYELSCCISYIGNQFAQLKHLLVFFNQYLSIIKKGDKDGI